MPTRSATLVIPQESGNATETVTLWLVENDETFNEFISLHERGDSAIIELADDREGWLVLSENIAVVYGIEAGDVVMLNGHMVGVRAVCEGYTGSNVYMSKGAYESLFNAGLRLRRIRCSSNRTSGGRTRRRRRAPFSKTARWIPWSSSTLRSPCSRT